MGFKYDFDMFSVIPEEVRQEFQGFLNDVGMGPSVGKQVALFRDPTLVEALSSADEKVKNLFLDAGFGLNVYDSGAPEGRFPGHDEAGRNACVRKLSENIGASQNLKQANWGGFNILEFVDYFSAAKPIDEIEMQAIAKAQQARNKKKSLARLGVMAGGAMIAVSAAGILLGATGG
ncbi:hypothetical protein [uncultured Roseovarius sp.]|uniref:hypothetical protein n=1 Tax=uncultured Roseovarius sp. TaxID=293344 RepID=UPI0026133ED8|nr:hypothetical protein [uncultured Roseovarius sp.]